MNPCLLCGAPPDLIGVFVPIDPGAWGAAAGKVRAIRYCLCDSCAVEPGAADRLEKVIEHELLQAEGV
ncbi:MAG: hypothetical protein C4519_18820 [Desulfobacteraceae bacterium]|nr:MAG: hypothetical protein C4519_18820 [Desulfobacteraceae bacterium]